MLTHDSRPIDPELGNERRWRESAGSAPALTWLAVMLLFLVGIVIWFIPPMAARILHPDLAGGGPDDLMAAGRGRHSRRQVHGEGAEVAVDAQGVAEGGGHHHVAGPAGMDGVLARDGVVDAVPVGGRGVQGQHGPENVGEPRAAGDH